MNLLRASANRLSACGRALRPWLWRTLLPAAVLDPSGQASPARAAAMRNGRCKVHGGNSTGPRTLVIIFKQRAQAEFRRFTAVAQKSPHGEISSAADQLARVANDTNLFKRYERLTGGAVFSLQHTCNMVFRFSHVVAYPSGTLPRVSPGSRRRPDGRFVQQYRS
jgi:hypothetical protein